MANWAYVVFAYGVVWGSLAAYALVLRRRSAQTRAGIERMRHMIDHESDSSAIPEESACDAPSVL